METQAKSTDINKPTIQVVETIPINDPNYMLLTWEDLPGFILEFPYYCFINEKIMNVRKKDTILMAMSKMTGLYKHPMYNHTLTDLSKPNVPRLYWNYDDSCEEDKRSIYNFMLEILRMTIIPRLHKIPKL